MVYLYCAALVFVSVIAGVGLGLLICKVVGIS